MRRAVPGRLKIEELFLYRGRECCGENMGA